MWALIPLDLVREILSRLGLKANIRASTVCKAWREAAVSVRKLHPRPLLFDPMAKLPQWRYDHVFSCSRDGWLLMGSYHSGDTIFLNPFTLESFDLPLHYRGPFSAFSAAPTSASCMVISFSEQSSSTIVVIDTWRPGETEWTTLGFENQSPRSWIKCVFSNGMFYILSDYGELGVFDPSKETWNILPVKPCQAFTRQKLRRRSVLMTEHEGDIFVIRTHSSSKPTVFKLNLKRKVWEEKRDLGGLTVFASFPASFARAGLAAEERNRIYTSDGMYYTLGDAKTSYPPPKTNLDWRMSWVEPPHNNITL